MCAFFRPRIENNAIKSQTISVTGTSAATLLGKGGALHLRNAGSGTCHVSFGDKNAVATTSHLLIPSGAELTIRRPMEAEYIAAISGTTATLHLTHGDL